MTQRIECEDTRGVDSVSWSDTDWHSILKSAVRTTEDLADLLGFESVPKEWLSDSAFPLRVPLPYLERVERNNPLDPLLLQVLPHTAELLTQPGFTDDPLVESDHLVAPGVIQKYHSRVLLITSPACAIHCRYCFRRNFPYTSQRVTGSMDSLEAIRSDSSIEEVILSGGDPLMLVDAKLAGLIERLDNISHVLRIRIHTRLPVVIPQRVTSTLCQILASTRTKLVLVAHFNHPNEIGADVREALERLGRVGVTLLNQSVLLKGVNDSAATLALLSNRLFDIGVLPYYLHLLDRVSGTGHFEVEFCEATQIYQELQSKVSGYLLPRLVREVPGLSAKQVQTI